MARKVLYRIENEHGRGMYGFSPKTDDGYSVDYLISKNLYNFHNHKTPDFDALLSDVWGYRPGVYNDNNDYADNIRNHPKYDVGDFWHFGFSSIHQLLNWVKHKETREAIEQCKELYLSVYEVDEANFRQGECQCIFVPVEAVLLDKIQVWEHSTYGELMMRYGK